MKTIHRTGAGLGLVLACLAALGGTAAADDPKQALQDIEKELQKEQKDFRAAAQAAAGDDAALSELYREFRESILPEFATRYAELARANAATDVALDAWLKVAGLAAQGLEGPLGTEALEVLVRDHLQAPGLGQLASNLRYSSVAEDARVTALRAIAERSPHREAQAAALYSLGAVLGDQRAEGDPRLAEAKAIFTKLADYADVKYRGGSNYAEAAKSYLFALENLAVGKPCPDFGAVDVEGAAFELSDYAGKVVLIDFWGFW